MLKSLIRRAVPRPLLRAYHFALARFAARWYGFPSEQLIVIGVTGTNGKSSTCQFIGRMLEQAGCRVGWTTTAGFKVAEREWSNAKKMTMLGRFQTQKLLRDMVKAGCGYAIVETSSQGIDQSRHVGINYDVAVFTNLTPEHIEAHGGFENYKRAKGKLFAHLARGHRKPSGDGLREKAAVINVDDAAAGFFLSFPSDRKYGYGVGVPHHQAFVPVIAEQLKLSAEGTEFSVEGFPFRVKPIGLFNAYNILAAIATLRALGLPFETIMDGAAALESVPGRLEVVDEGQPFTVIVDYAYEPAALEAAYAAVRLLKRKRLIHVLGSAGGGRDTARRSVLGAMAAREADIVIVTNEDPYDDNPQTIMDQVADGALREGKKDGETLHRVLDRQDAITLAIELATRGDVVLITGKGSEPVMAVAGGRSVPWDDRVAVRRALHSLK